MKEKSPLWTEGELRKKRPCCGKEMENGTLMAPGGRGVYWLPGGAHLKGGLITPSRVEKSGGLSLGKVLPIGFLAQDPPITYYCRAWRRLFTFLDGEEPSG